jgi:hypothetical protein
LEFRKLVRQFAFARSLFGFVQLLQYRRELLMATFGAAIEYHSLSSHLLSFIQVARHLQQKGKRCVFTSRRRALREIFPEKRDSIAGTTDLRISDDQMRQRVGISRFNLKRTAQFTRGFVVFRLTKV